MKVLLTGVAGFIGSAFAAKLLEEGYQVTGIDNLNQYYDVKLKLDRLVNIGLPDAIREKRIGWGEKISAHNGSLAFYLVDPVFADPGSFPAGTLWLAMFGYAVQIYADFSGYSNMAIGSARILGFRIPENFLFPYLATDFSKFWRRWHITMSTFFRDYVYIPLGGNRCSRFRVLINLAATMLICAARGSPRGDEQPAVLPPCAPILAAEPYT